MAEHFYGFLMPQRAFLYGMPLAFLGLTLVLVGKRRDDALAFVTAGAVVGLLPLAHLATMLALAIVTPFMALLLPTRKWIGFFAAWILVALPQLLLQQGGAPGALASLRFQLGWVMGTVPWPVFWLKQVGLFLPLVVVALALPRLLPKDSYRLLVAFMAIFVAANILGSSRGTGTTTRCSSTGSLPPASWSPDSLRTCGAGGGRPFEPRSPSGWSSCSCLACSRT